MSYVLVRFYANYIAGPSDPRLDPAKKRGGFYAPDTNTDTDSDLNGPEVRCPTLGNNDKKAHSLVRDKCQEEDTQWQPRPMSVPVCDPVNPERIRILFSVCLAESIMQISFFVPRRDRPLSVRTVSEQAVLCFLIFNFPSSAPW